jgi:AcrR family transcriptional regulator
MAGNERLTREQSAARTRLRLLDAALTLLGERGYHATTLNDVAAEAGYTIGAIYKHFPSKDALMLATLEEHPDGRAGALLAILTGPGDLGSKLDACADAWSARLREGGFARLVVEYRLQNRRQDLFAHRYRETMAEDYAALAAALDTAARDSGVTLGLPAPDLISLASALFDGAALREVAMPGQVTPELLRRGLRRLCGLPDGTAK